MGQDHAGPVDNGSRLRRVRDWVYIHGPITLGITQFIHFQTRKTLQEKTPHIPCWTLVNHSSENLITRHDSIWMRRRLFKCKIPTLVYNDTILALQSRFNNYLFNKALTKTFIYSSKAPLNLPHWTNIKVEPTVRRGAARPVGAKRQQEHKHFINEHHC